VTVVVTGAAGLLGSHVVRAVAATGRDVRSVDLRSTPSANRGTVQADLSDLGAAVQALAGASAVVHAAAIPRPTGRTSVDVFRTNVLAAYNVAEAAVLHGVTRLVNASSISVLGPPFNPRPMRPSYLPIDDDHPLAPQEAYALSKQLTEEIVAAATRRSDLTAVSLRMPWIQTPESFAGDIFPHRAEAAIGASNLWAYIDARDAAQAFVRALDAPIDGHTSLYLSAADTFMEEDTQLLVHANFGNVELRKPLAGHQSLIDLTAATDVLGFRPGHSWRSYEQALR
jgi:nucleoside-diphosphate-sugar epimerase